MQVHNATQTISMFEEYRQRQTSVLRQPISKLDLRVCINCAPARAPCQCQGQILRIMERESLGSPSRMKDSILPLNAALRRI